ncbi:MAG: DNA polymerase I [Planctomycetes bacterium]|nr:DNA polymerase I [Planctomycetota bacterium]
MIDTPPAEQAGAATRPPTFMIIDGFAQLFRAYHAIRNQLTSPVTNEPTNATFGYVGMLLKVFEQYQPDYLAVAIDVSGDRGTFRSDLYEDYKANREPPPEDFYPQVDRSWEITRLFGIPVIGAERYEADDVIATLVTQLQEQHPDLRMQIVSKDKDLEQLLSDRVEMLDVHKDERVTVATLHEKKGIRPEQVIDMLALMGDTVDNVPGVPGIGPKTASQLIQQYGSLDGVLEHIDEIKGKRRENIENSRDLLPLSRDLVTLRHDVDVQFALDDARVDLARADTATLLSTLERLGFNRFRQDLERLISKHKIEGAQQEPGVDVKPDDDDDDEASRPAPSAYTCVRTEQELKAVIQQMRAASVVAIDTETTSVAPMRAQLCGISISVEPHTGVYIPVRSPEPDTHLNLDQVRSLLGPVLADPDDPPKLIGHNIKYDLIILRRHGFELAHIHADTMVAAYVHDSTRSSLSMDALAMGLLNHRCIPISDLLGPQSKASRRQQAGAAAADPERDQQGGLFSAVADADAPRTFADVELDEATEYAAEDADITLRLWQFFEPRLKAMGLLDDLFHRVEMPLVTILADMEQAGIHVDRGVLAQQREALSALADHLRTKITHAAPEGARAFNPDSPKQLAAVLFNKPTDDPPGLGLPILKKRKTGPSTDMEVLEKLAADPDVSSTIPTDVIEYRQLTKLVSTYLVALDDYIDPDTHRVHASFNQTIAATGRLSSSDPNLQNIPIRTETGRQIRKAFQAEAGSVLVTADYSQIELRLLAHLSEDETLINAFLEGQDIHRSVAAQIHGVSIDDVTAEQRQSAKMVNFGIVYGITAYGLARRLGGQVTTGEAAEIISGYKARYPGIDAFLQRCIAEAQRQGYVATILGRRRAVPQILSRRPQERSLGERVAINSVVQGSAADLIKLAMISLHAALPTELPEARLLLQIHDELVFEVPQPLADQTIETVRRHMESAMELRVPIVVDTAVSANWMECK